MTITIDKEQAKTILDAAESAFSEGMAGPDDSIVKAILLEWPELADECTYLFMNPEIIHWAKDKPWLKGK